MDKIIKPLYDRLLVKVMEQEEVTKSGIIIPAYEGEVDERKGESKMLMGEVLEMGDGRIERGRKVPMKAGVGDVIVFMRYAGNRIRIGTDEYYVVREGDVLCKVFFEDSPDKGDGAGFSDEVTRFVVDREEGR